MSDTLTEDQYHLRIRELIAEAVVEPDDGRRHSLLFMADEWGALLLRRRHLHADGEQGA